MSLPIVLAGNIVLSIKKFSFTLEEGVSILTAFLWGMASIHLFLKLAVRVPFGPFVLTFGMISILFSLI